MTRRIALACVAVFVLAFALRAAFLISVTGTAAPLAGDEPDYHSVAVSFLSGNGWRDAHGKWSYRPPLISVQLLALYVLTGPDTAAARWLMVFTSALTAPAIVLLTLRLLPREIVAAVLAGLVWAVYPESVFLSTHLYTENLAALLSVCSVYAMLWTSEARRRWALAALTGLLWGLMALNRPVYLVLPFFLLAVQMVLKRMHTVPWSWPWRSWSIALIAMLAALLPWTVRNYRIHHVLMPSTSGLGWLMMQCNGSLANPIVQDGLNFKRPELVAIMDQATNEVAWDQTGRRLALAEVRRNWRLLPTALLKRALNFWVHRPTVANPRWTVGALVMLAFWTPVLVLFSLSFRVWPWPNDWTGLAMIAHAFVCVLPFWGAPRFRFPVDPLIIVHAVGAAWTLLQALPGSRRAVPTWNHVRADAANVVRDFGGGSSLVSTQIVGQA